MVLAHLVVACRSADLAGSVPSGQSLLQEIKQAEKEREGGGSEILNEYMSIRNAVIIESNIRCEDVTDFVNSYIQV